MDIESGLEAVRGRGAGRAAVGRGLKPARTGTGFRRSAIPTMAEDAEDAEDVEDVEDAEDAGDAAS